MGRRLREAAKFAGDVLPGKECLGVMIRRWEKDSGGVSERYRLHYCKAFQIPLDQFGHSPAVEMEAVPLPSPATLTVADESRDNERQPPSPGLVTAEPAIVVIAHEHSQHAQDAERRDIGEATLEQLRATVMRLSRDTMTGAPLALLAEMRRIYDQLRTASSLQVWPADQAELYLLLGCLNSLMSVTALQTGSLTAAAELARAGLPYARAIGHQALAAHLRLNLATIAYWNDQPRQCHDLTSLALGHQPNEHTAARLHSLRARTAARLGDATTVSLELRAAAERERDDRDDLTTIGGEFSFSQATQHYYAGSALVEIPDAERDAITELEHALSLYAADTGHDYSQACIMATRIDLATAWLRLSDLDAARTAAGPVLAIAPANRMFSPAKRFGPARTALAASRYRGSAEAREFDDQIEQFSLATTTTNI